MKKYLLSLFTLTSLIAFLFLNTSFMGLIPSQQIIETAPDLKLGQTYIPHDPIEIDGDLDLNQTVLAEGWLGNGTKDDPYIIENYLISGATPTYQAAIEIQNVHQHVIIRNNLLQSSMDKANKGLLVWGSTNVIMKDNEIKNFYTGLDVINGINITIQSNTVVDNFYGCIVGQTENILFERNIISNSSLFGFLITYVTNITFQSNFIRFSNLMSSMMGELNSFQHSSSVVIYNNTFEGCTYYSFYITTTDQTQIVENMFLDSMGIYLITSNSNNITRNQFNNPIGPNINIATSNNNIIFINNFYPQTISTNPVLVDTLGNLFYNNMRGNYWSTYDGNDTNNDGIGDNPFAIDADNSDPYPLIDPVDFEKPNITDCPSDLSFTTEETVSINWTAFDENPTTYEIFQEGVSVKTGAYENGTTNIELGSLAEGIYTFRVVLSDKDGNTTSFSTTITVTTVSEEEMTSTTLETGTKTITSSTEDALAKFISENLVQIAVVGAVALVGLFILKKLFRRSKK